MAVCLASLSCTACSQSGNTPNTDGGNPAVTTADTATESSPAVETTENPAAEETSEAAEDTAETENPDENRRFGVAQDNTKIDLFSSSMTDGQGKEYEVRVYMYHIDNGDDAYKSDHFPIEDGMLRGSIALELLEDGESVYDGQILKEYFGQVAKSYYIPKIEDYFSLLHLDGGDVLVCSYPDHASELWFTSYYTVRDGELRLMERYFSDEEKKEIEQAAADGSKIRPGTAVYEFITVNKFTTDKNRIVYELESEVETSSAYSYEGGTYPAGDIPLLFDFENNTVKCEKDEYAGLVYSYFDLG